MSDPIEELRACLPESRFAIHKDKIAAVITAYDAKCAELERSRGNAQDWRQIAEENTATGEKYRAELEKVKTDLSALRSAEGKMCAEIDLLTTALDSERAKSAALEAAVWAHCFPTYRNSRERFCIACGNNHANHSEDCMVGNALATDAGKPFLDRLREAEVLLNDVRCYEGTIITEDIPFFEWCKRRDAILTQLTNKTKGGK